MRSWGRAISSRLGVPSNVGVAASRLRHFEYVRRASMIVEAVATEPKATKTRPAARTRPRTCMTSFSSIPIVAGDRIGEQRVLDLRPAADVVDDERHASDA